MKLLLRLLIGIFILFEVFSMTFAREKICKYRGKQMTTGQSVTDCYAIMTCEEGGVLNRRKSCPSYSCSKKKRGYKPYNPRKPYPDCCGGPICDEMFKTYYYRPGREYF